MAFCPNCGTQQTNDSTYCTNCGTKLAAPQQKKICPQCNHELKADMMFCDQCGARYSEPYGNQPYMATSSQSIHMQNQFHSTAYTKGSAYKPEINTGLLTVLSIICIFLCWPAAFYGFFCRSRAYNATSQEEANNAIHQGVRACIIGLIIIAALFMIGILCEV